jgi:hypothetical protein
MAAKSTDGLVVRGPTYGITLHLPRKFVEGQ